MAVSISLAITQNSQNIANNTSNVTVKVTAKWTYGSWNGTGNASGSITIDGTKYNFSGITFNTGRTTTGSQVIMTKTVNVSHKSDGTKTLSCSASFATGVNSGTVTTSGSKVLTTIARATKPTVSKSSVDMGGAVTINTPRASSGFKHDLAYSFAGGCYVNIATGVGTSYEWTTPDLASDIPSSASGTVTIRCITKSGSTTIGTKTVTMTLKVPSSVVPTISAVAVSEAVAGLAAQFGAYIQSKSKLSVKITAAGAKGSTIKSYKTTLQGSNYTKAEFTTSLLTSSGSLSMVTTVTDTRGRTAKKTTTVKVLAYTKPQVQALTAYRYNAAGFPAEDGEYIGVDYAYSVPLLDGGNTAAMTLEYKLSTEADSAYTAMLTSTATSADTTAMLAEPTFSTDYSYMVRLTVVDYFGAKASRTWPLPSGAVILDIRSDGLGLGLFTVASREGVDFGASAKGAVVGLWEATAEIPENGDFDEWLQPGVYAVPKNETMATLKNRPCDRGGTLRVSSGIGTKKISGAYAYIVQEFHCYHNTEPIYRRHIISNGDGVFSPGPWRAITFRGQKVLWSGGKYMTADHQADLSEPVSQQDNGIVLVFSTYQDGAAVDANFNHFFVPKQFVSMMGGYGSAFQMHTVNFSGQAAKYLYIHDTYIKGNDNNSLSGTAAGITFNNAMYVLRYVLGV